ncbi:hypothetical protein BKA80DRAFT_280557 [Phyllosticta citrichinensis]
MRVRSSWSTSRNSSRRLRNGSTREPVTAMHLGLRATVLPRRRRRWLASSRRTPLTALVATPQMKWPIFGWLRTVLTGSGCRGRLCTVLPLKQPWRSTSLRRSKHKYTTGDGLRAPSGKTVPICCSGITLLCLFPVRQKIAFLLQGYRQLTSARTMGRCYHPRTAAFFECPGLCALSVR